MSALAAAAAGPVAVPGVAPARLQHAPQGAGWQRHCAVGGAGASTAQRRDVAAAAKRRLPSKPGRSSAGGGGRGRSAPRDRAAVKELSVALKDGRQRNGSGSGSDGSGGFGGSQRAGRRGRSRGGSVDEASDTEGDADWDEELLADLSDSGKQGLSKLVQAPSPVSAACKLWL